MNQQEFESNLNQLVRALQGFTQYDPAYEIEVTDDETGAVIRINEDNYDIFAAGISVALHYIDQMLIQGDVA